MHKIHNLGGGVYRVYERTDRGLVDIGDILKVGRKRWQSRPAVDGAPRPMSFWLDHKTRREAVARLLRHMRYAEE